MSPFADRGPLQGATSYQSKPTVILKRRQIALLDRLAVDIRHNRHVMVSRSDLIQAIIDAWQSSGVDLSKACSEEEIAETMRDAWGGKRKRRR